MPFETEQQRIRLYRAIVRLSLSLLISLIFFFLCSGARMFRIGRFPLTQDNKYRCLAHRFVVRSPHMQ